MVDAQVLKGAWSFDNDVLGDTEIIDGNDIVVQLQLMRGQHMRAGATTFANAFDGDNSEHAYALAALQLFLKTANDLELLALSTDNKLRGKGHVCNLFVEALLRHERDNLLGPEDLGGTPDRIAKRSFMRNVPDNVVVDGYRFVVCVKKGHGAVTFGDKWMATVDQLERDYLKNDTQATVQRARDPDNSGDTGVSLMSYSGGASGANPNAYGRSLGPTQKWRLVRNRHVWATVADTLLGVARLSTPSMRDRIATRARPYNDNPLNPHYALAPQLFFQHAFKSIDDQQTTLTNYTVVPRSVEQWRFPVPSLVLRVPHSDMSIERFMHKMMPEFQARLGADLIDRMTLERRRARERRLLTRARYDQSNGNVSRTLLPPRTMVRRTLEFGEAGDIDDFLGADGLGDDVTSSLVGGDEYRDGTSSSSSSSSASTFQTVIDPDFAPCGGKTYSSIAKILDSVQCHDCDGNYVAVDVDVLEREDFEDASSQTARRLLESTDKSSSSSFHRLRAIGATLRSRIIDASNILDRLEMRRLYTSNSRTLLRLYEDLCTTPTSDVSSEGQKINAWLAARTTLRDTETLTVDEPLFDPSMSTFANVFARRMLALESSFYVTSLHLMIMTAIYGSRDAYRHELALHFNSLYVGEAELGKSFVPLCVKYLSIYDTVLKIDNETGAAAYVDTDHNDQIFFCEEAKPDKFKDRRHGGDDRAEAEHKEYLTSMLRSRKVFFKGEDGSRQHRISYSQQIATFMVCSNLTYEEFTRAVRSRYSCASIANIQRDDRITTDMVNVEKRLEGEALVARETFTDEMCVSQFFQYHVEKLIGVYALTDITLTAFDTISQLITRHLRERHAISVTRRTVERAAMLARKLVIDHAAWLVFSTPHSPHFKKPFDHAMLLDLDPLLHDNEEIACFALELVSHEIVDGERPHFIATLRRRVVEREIARIDNSDVVDRKLAMRNVYLQKHTKILRSSDESDFDHNDSSYRKRYTPGARSVRKDKSSDAPTNGSRTSAVSSVIAAKTGSNDAGFNDFVIAESIYPPEYLNAYVRIAGTPHDIAMSAARWSRDTSMTLDEDKCRSIMRKMARKEIVSRIYMWSDDANRPKVNPKAGNVRVPALLYTANAIFIALDLLTSDDPMSAAIEYTRSKLLRGKRRKYLRAKHYNLQHPHLLATRHVSKDDGIRHSIIDYARQRTASTMYASISFERHGLARKDLRSGRTSLEYHYDEMSARARARMLHLDENKASSPLNGVCSFDPYERVARTSYCRTIPIDYPTGIIAIDSDTVDTKAIDPLDIAVDARVVDKLPGDCVALKRGLVDENNDVLGTNSDATVAPPIEDDLPPPHARPRFRFKRTPRPHHLQ